MVRRKVVVAVALLPMLIALLAPACTDLDEPPVGDELSDFSTTTSSGGGMPYDVYVRISQQMNLEVLGFAEAEGRSTTLCAAGSVIEDPRSARQDEWSATDRALVRAYCPSLELGG